MTLAEKMQKLIMCVSTLYRLNGCMPSRTELATALGKEYSDVLSEYTEIKNMTLRFAV